MSEVGAATPAHDLCTVHEVTVVRHSRDILFVVRLEEAGPARPGVELRVGTEQRRPAAYAAVHPFVVIVPVFSGERSFGSFLTRHVELLWSKGFSPLCVRARRASTRVGSAL